MAEETPDTPFDWEDLGQRVQAKIKEKFLPRCSAEESSLVTTHLMPLVKFTPKTIWTSTHSLSRVKYADKYPPMLHWGFTCFVFGITRVSKLKKFQEYIKSNANALSKFQVEDEPCIPLPNGVGPSRAGEKRKAADDTDGDDIKRRVKSKTGSMHSKSSNRGANQTTEVKDGAADLDNPDTEAKENDANLDNRETKLSDRDSGLPSHEARLKNAETSLDSRETALKDHESVLNSRAAELKDREAGLEDREIELNGRKTGLDAHDTALEDRGTELDSIETELNNREASFSIRKAALEISERELKDLEASLSLRKAVLDSSRADLEKREAELEKRETDFNNRKPASRATTPHSESDCKQEHIEGSLDTQARPGRLLSLTSSADYQKSHNDAILSTNDARVLFDIAVSNVTDAKCRDELIERHKVAVETLFKSVNLCFRISLQMDRK